MPEEKKTLPADKTKEPSKPAPAAPGGENAPAQPQPDPEAEKHPQGSRSPQGSAPSQEQGAQPPAAPQARPPVTPVLLSLHSRARPTRRVARGRTSLGKASRARTNPGRGNSARPNQANQASQGKPASAAMDWLRNKPVGQSGPNKGQPARGLDLGRHNAWSAKPPVQPGQPGQTGQPPQPGQPGQPTQPGQQGTRPPTPYNQGPRPPYNQGQRPPTPYNPGPRPPYNQGQRPPTPYNQGPRPPYTPGQRPPYTPGQRPPYTPGQGGTGAPYGQRPPYQGPPGSRPSFPPRTGGAGRPPFAGRGGAPAQPFKPTDLSRRARSGSHKPKEKDKREIPEQETEEQKIARALRRAEEAKGIRSGILKPGTGLLKPTAADEGPKAVTIPARLTVKDFSAALGVSSVDVIKELMKNGIMAPINQVIDYDTAAVVASDLGFEIAPAVVEEKEPVAVATAVVEEKAAAKRQRIAGEDSHSVTRPPVVTIMGHVDHGKTSLLDVIRRTNVAGGEAGGITQHIGAYQVDEKGKKITFLDTPGHEAFTAMRARGAQATDVVVLVVAADDGVQPQTIEAINHARAAGVPLVVALNKIDKENANPDHVKQQLSEAGLVPEEWGGNTVIVPVSAKKNTGINDLLDMILLVSEMADLKANPNRPASGTIVEAEMDKAKGPTATVLVQQGTLRVGDYVVVGDNFSRVRAMFNDRGKSIKKAEPATPASILGLTEVPTPGDTLDVQPDEKTARAVSDERREKRQRGLGGSARVSLDDLFQQIQSGTLRELNIILKADVQGSLEPIVNSIEKLSDDQVKVRVLHQSTGAITESDISLGAASKAIVIGFNVEPDVPAKRAAEQQGVEVRTFKIIYDVVDAIGKAVKGLYEPKYAEVVDGHAEVRALFKTNRGTIAGCYVTDGMVTRSNSVRVKRNGESVFEGKMSSLRRVKDDVTEVKAGLECGIMLDGFSGINEKDILETFHKERVN